MENIEEKASDGLKRLLNGVKLRKSVILRRLEAGRTIQLDLQTKAQLLTIISNPENKDTPNLSAIIQEGQNLRIVAIADPFAPQVSIYVYTVEKDSKSAPES